MLLFPINEAIETLPGCGLTELCLGPILEKLGNTMPGSPKGDFKPCR